MSGSPSPRRPSRLLLATIAQREAALQLKGDVNKAGPAIERYLSVFREALNQNCDTTRYSDLKLGYSWCCAFVYYCCQEAGFVFPPKPDPHHRYTLAAVPAWHNWAVKGHFYYPASTSKPEMGDITLFNNVDVGQPLDHAGIVVGFEPDSLLCAEGAIENRTGFFKRPYSCVDGYVRLPEIC